MRHFLRINPKLNIEDTDDLFIIIPNRRGMGGQESL